MNIARFSVRIPETIQYTKANQPVNNDNVNKEVSFQGTQQNKDKIKKGALLAAVLAATVPLNACNQQNVPANSGSDVEANQQNPSANDATNQIGAIDAAMGSSDGKIIPIDSSFMAMPVTEFYFTTADKVVTLKPNEDLPRNDKGTVLVTITDGESDRIDEGNTLNEIIEKVYSDALDEYDEEEQAAIVNKFIDEIVQANPSLAKYIHDELGDGITNYEQIANLNLYHGDTSVDQTLDTRVLTIPTAVVYQVQGQEPDNISFANSSSVYTPVNESASVIKDSDDLLEGEYASFSDMIYANYGEDISDEAYRDIVYAVVNSPLNAVEFEYVIDNMNINDLIKTGNITDLNRTLNANTDKEMIGISLPSVATLRDVSSIADVDTAKKNGIVYQISPSAFLDGQDDLSVTILSNNNENGKMEPGDVFSAIDILQFYTSPDGNGRFASVNDQGELVLNSDVNYSEVFASQILQQFAYANINVFAAQYEDADGNTHEYGVFDVDPNYDTTGKSIDDILAHSTINIERLLSYSFVDENGQSKFEDGVKLNLPQFNYRINDCERLAQTPTNPTTPTTPTNPTTPTTPTNPTTPTTPTNPTTPTTPTNPTTPTTPTNPTTPTTPTNPTTPTTPTNPTTPTTPTNPTTPTTPTNPTTPTTPTNPTNPTTPTNPTEPTCPSDPTEEPTNEDRPTDIPTTPTDSPTQRPTLPTNPSDPTIQPTNPGEEIDPVEPPVDCEDPIETDEPSKEERPPIAETPENSPTQRPQLPETPNAPVIKEPELGDEVDIVDPSYCDSPSGTDSPSGEIRPGDEDDTTQTPPASPDDDLDSTECDSPSASDEYEGEGRPGASLQSTMSTPQAAQTETQSSVPEKEQQTNVINDYQPVQNTDNTCQQEAASDVVEKESRDSILSNVTSSVLGNSDEDIEYFE